MVRLGALVLVLGACDRLLNLQPVATPDAPIVLAQGQTSLAAGEGHSCWIAPDGALYCWGENEYGQLGLQLDANENDAVARVGDAKWTAIAAGYYHTCGIQADRTLWCWGDDFYGELGNGQTSTVVRAPVQIPGSWSAVAGGVLHTCAVASDGTLSCWGDNEIGQLGDGTTSSQSAPVAHAGTWTKVCAGQEQSCALATDGTISCWGGGEAGQLGDGTNTNRGLPVAISSSETFIDVACGLYHTCAQTTSGHLRCWGNNNLGQLGIGNTDSKPAPVPVFVDGQDKADWAGIVASHYHTCAWDRSNVAYCWGDSSRGELGQDGGAINVSPMIMPGGPWTAAAAGAHHVCLLDATGRPWCMGANGWGQLGTGTNAGLPAPQQVGTATNWAWVAAGSKTTCAVDTSNHASCGGDNEHGQLGLGDLVSTQKLAALDTSNQWQSLALGDSHTCGAAGFKAYCWGDNFLGQAGVGLGLAYLTSPAEVTFPSNVDYQFETMSASDHSCAIGINVGKASCWGPNDAGQIGDGTQSTPVSTPSGPIMRTGDPTSAWSHIGTGYIFTCGLEYSLPGKAWCWGNNYEGELGDDQAELRTNSPVMVISGTTTFLDLAVGGLHACAIDGQTRGAWCWGYNGSGELGVQDYIEHHTPALVAGGHAWDQLAAGGHHTCGIETGKLYCWGDNRRGQLGNGDPTRGAVNAPTQIGSDSDWMSIATGEWHTCGVRAGQLYCWGGNDDGAVLDNGAWTNRAVQVTVP